MHFNSLFGLGKKLNSYYYQLIVYRDQNVMKKQSYIMISLCNLIHTIQNYWKEKVIFLNQNLATCLRSIKRNIEAV